MIMGIAECEGRPKGKAKWRWFESTSARTDNTFQDKQGRWAVCDSCDISALPTKSFAALCHQIVHTLKNVWVAWTLRANQAVQRGKSDVCQC
jgi:hypothetical protein